MKNRDLVLKITPKEAGEIIDALVALDPGSRLAERLQIRLERHNIALGTPGNGAQWRA